MLVATPGRQGWQGAHRNRHASARHRLRAWSFIRPRLLEKLESGGEMRMAISTGTRCSRQEMGFGRQRFGGRKLEKGCR